MCRRSIPLVSFVFVLAVCSAAVADLAGWEAAIGGAGPLNWYKFDETGAECIDSGSGGLNGTYDSVSLGQEGRFGPGTAAGFERVGANRANFTGATNLPGPWTVEYVVKTTKAPAANDSQALHDSDTTSIRLAGWTALGETGFTLYGVADYQFTPEAGLTLDDLVIQPDVWMHLVWRNNGSGTQLFFDGMLVGTSTDMIELPRLRIGGRGAGPADHLQGVLDEAVVFGRALTDDEIFAHASTTFPLEATNPVPENGALHADTWVNLSWTAGSTAASHDVYLGDDFDQVNEGAGDTFRGNQSATFYVAGFPGFAYPEGLVPGTTYYWRIDEVEADGITKHTGNVWSFSIPPKTAYNPNPADGAEFVATDAKLNWTAGFGAKLHTVYFGTDFDSVSNAAGGLPQGTTTYNPGPLEAEKIYYWRVDEFDAVATHKGNVWSFTTPGAVGNPQPANGAADVQMNAKLSWTAATTAVSHDVYFGTDKDAVKNATTASVEYKGNKSLGSESHDPGKLAWHSDYYWRVDAVYNAGTVKGLVWSFTTADFIAVDDFESYNDIDPPDPVSNRIFDKWIDGFGTTDNGALVGNDLPPYAEQTIVHSGGQSLIYRYD
ncbi:MAG: LamG-like jellyroll fold domain-containing protein, partial [Planctomycetota bacterium]